MNSINPVEFGKLMAQVQHLSDQLEEAQQSMALLNERLAAVEDKYRLGKAGITGLVIGLGFTIYGVKEGLSHLLGWVAK